MEVIHPTARMVCSLNSKMIANFFESLISKCSFRLFQLVEISKAQDIEAGDGTTSVVVMAGALLKATTELMAKGLHPTAISDGF